MLDGLHEDLNRVPVKPYVEMPDSEDVPDPVRPLVLLWDVGRIELIPHLSPVNVLCVVLCVTGQAGTVVVGLPPPP